MKISEVKLMAYVDDQLPADERLAVEAAIATDQDAAAYVARQMDLKATLDGIFDPVLQENVPAHLTRAVLETSAQPSANKHQPFSLVTIFGSWRDRGFLLPLGAATASGAILGVAIAFGLTGSPVLHSDNGRLVAGGVLASALSSDLAVDTQNDIQARIGVSFRARDGRFCRTFSSEDTQGALAGIACHEGDEWRVAVLSGAESSAGGIYAPAGSALPEIVRNGVASMISGEPLDADAERAARDGGWNP